MTRSEAVIYVARLFRFVREIKTNAGLWIGFMQQGCDGKPGDSWCADFVCFVLAIVFGGYSNIPIKRSGSVHEIYLDAKAKGYVTSKPVQIGDLFVYVNAAGHAHHIGFVTDDEPTLMGIAGNTSPDGTSDNGTGVFEHEVFAKEFIHYPRGE
jgi:hypothetical protein